MSSTVACSGMLMVFEMAPEMNGCTAAHHAQVPERWIERAPRAGLNAQSKTGRCSARRSRRALDRLLLVDVLDDVLHLARVVAETRAARAARCC